MKISVVAPFYNEEGSVKELYERLLAALKKLGDSHEIIFIDDGSADATFEEMKKLAPLTAIRLRKNYGQTAALAAGIDAASGEIIVAIDGDLENQPEDMPRLLEKMKEGFDVVSGWRQDRWKGQGLRRRPLSKIANWLISFVTKTNLHDHGCTLKVYKADVLKQLNLYGDMHRMIAAYAVLNGAKVAEIPVKHVPRKYGKSKYGVTRTFRVLLDLIVVKFFAKYSNRPMHFFGGAGFWSFFLGFLTFLLMIYFKYFGGKTFIQTPLPIVTGLVKIAHCLSCPNFFIS